MKKHIPNIITLMNLFSGCIAIVMTFSNNFLGVVLWVVIAALFDFLDGMAARTLNAHSEIGKELDSLADVLSFGAAPAFAIFNLLKNFAVYPALLEPIQQFIPYIAFIIPAFSALRLAKFNLDDRQTTSFLGLPTPANALFWISYCYGIQNITTLNENFIYLTVLLIFILSYLLISEIPMFSLKINKLQLRGNEKQIILIIIMIVFTSIWGISGMALGIISYIILSLIPSKKRLNR